MRTNRAPDRLNDLITLYAKGGVSDVHAHPGEDIRISLHKVLYADTENPAAGAEEIESWIQAATGQSSHELFGSTGHACASLEADAARLRCTFRRGLSGISASFRLIPRDVPTMESLDLSQGVTNLIHRESGLIMIDGGTGHGKSWLAGALLRGIGETYDKHLYLVEDPIEFIHPNYGNSSVIQREVGLHVSNYAAAVEDALRSHPHVIMIGEMLDPETARAALRAATTGHLVITTAHAGSVTEAVEGFIGQFSAAEQPQMRTRFAQSLLAIINQRLVPAAGGGLVAAREVMINSLNFSSLIRNGKEDLIYAQLAGAGANGCQTLEDDLARLVSEGKISRQTALTAAVNPAGLRDSLLRFGDAA